MEDLLTRDEMIDGIQGATKTFLNECARGLFTQKLPVHQGKTKKYTEVHYFEFRFLCYMKLWRMSRAASKSCLRMVAKETGYNKVKKPSTIFNKIYGKRFVLWSDGAKDVTESKYLNRATEPRLIIDLDQI